MPLKNGKSDHYGLIRKVGGRRNAIVLLTAVGITAVVAASAFGVKFDMAVLQWAGDKWIWVAGIGLGATTGTDIVDKLKAPAVIKAADEADLIPDPELEEEDDAP